MEKTRFTWTNKKLRRLVFLTLEKKSSRAIAALLGCEKTTVRRMQLELELVPQQIKTQWTQEMEDELKKRYATTTAKVLSKQLQCSEGAVYQHAVLLHLEKSPEFLRECGRRSAQKNNGKGRFEKGHIPFNKGTHYMASGRAKETQFKKGSRPPNWCPIGTTRISKDGYLERKVTDTGCPQKHYVGEHRLLWEKHHGPVPAGHAVVFRDGEKTHITIENLELVSRAELMRRNSVHNYPDELFRVIQLKGVLKRRIKDLHEKQTG
jgi:hypothetical protein